MVIVINISLVIAIWILMRFPDSLSKVVPSPIDVAYVLFSNELYILIFRLFTTLGYVLEALLISISVGYFFGMTCAFSKRLKSPLYTICNCIKSVPITIFTPVFITAFHLKDFVVPMICFPVSATICVNIANAAGSINSTRENIFDSLSVSKLHYCRHVLFWETLETLFATLRIVITYALTLEIAIEYFMENVMGIGQYIVSHYHGYAEDKYSYVYAGIIVASTAGLVFVKLLDKFSERILRWKIQMH